MALALVRSLGTAKRFQSPQMLEDFEQELVDQYALAGVGLGLTDGHIAAERSVVFEFVRFLGAPLWTAQPGDADRFLVYQRRDGQLAKSTVQGKAWILARFYEFVIARYQTDVQALTGWVVGNRSTSSTGRRSQMSPRSGFRRQRMMWIACSPVGVNRCRAPASIFPRRGTIWPLRCGAGWACGSTRR